MKKILILLLFVPFLASAQKSPASKIIPQIKFEQDSVKAVYDWVTNNIRYDVNQLHQLLRQQGKTKVSKAQSPQARINSKVDKVLRTKQGVCQDYAYLFDAIVKELGYESHVVVGYSKKLGTPTIAKIGHVWNAVKVRGIWKLYDTTWGAGQVKDGKKFIKRYNPAWYDVPATEMIKTHMPYDPIWQFLASPVSYQNFKMDKFDASNKQAYNYDSKIASYLKKDRKERIQEELDRSKEMGNGTKLVIKWRNGRIKTLKGSAKTDSFNQNTQELNQAVATFNEYIAARKKRFKGSKWTLPYSKTQLEILKKKTEVILQNFRSTRAKGDKRKKIRKMNMDATRGLLKRTNAELRFLNKR